MRRFDCRNVFFLFGWDWTVIEGTVAMLAWVMRGMDPIHVEVPRSGVCETAVVGCGS